MMINQIGIDSKIGIYFEYNLSFKRGCFIFVRVMLQGIH